MSSADKEEDYIITFTKELLNNITFKGTYKCKEEVSTNNGKNMFDVISIDRSETQFIKDLQTARKRLQAFSAQSYWIGFGEPFDRLVVEELDLFPGTYYFTVESVEFTDSEIYLALKVRNRVYDFYTVSYFLVSGFFTCILVFFELCGFFLNYILNVRKRF